MNKIVAVLIIPIVLLLACGSPPQADKLRVIAEDYPPFNYVNEKGDIVGQSTEVVKAIMSKAGQVVPIEVMPWEKAYELTLKDPGTALYSMARTPEREHNFMWVGPIGSYENWLYAKKGSMVQASNFNEARALHAIAVVKDEAGQQKLADMGFINFVFTDTIADGLKKLMSGEADLWLGTREDVDMVAKKAGVNPDDLEPVLFVHKLDLYIGFNKNTSFATVDAWQKALNTLGK